MGCYGDGGAVFTDNDEYANLLRSYRVHGKGADKYDNVRVGMNSRLDTIQAAILLEKLDVFSKEVNVRNKISAKYESSLSGVFNTPKIPSGYVSSWAQYTLTDPARDKIIDNYKNHNIPCVIYYGKCMHLQTAFNYLGYSQGDFPISEKLSQQVFSLPMSPYLSDIDIDNVIVGFK